MKGGNHSDDGENASCPTAFGSVLRVPSTNAFAPYVSTHRCSPCAKPAPEYEMSCRSYLRTVSLTNSSTCVSLGGVLSSTGVTVPYGDCGKGSDGQLRSCQQAYGPREVLRVELPKELLLLESSSMLRLQDHCKEMIQRVAYHTCGNSSGTSKKMADNRATVRDRSLCCASVARIKCSTTTASLPPLKEVTSASGP